MTTRLVFRELCHQTRRPSIRNSVCKVRKARPGWAVLMAALPAAAKQRCGDYYCRPQCLMFYNAINGVACCSLFVGGLVWPQMLVVTSSYCRCALLQTAHTDSASCSGATRRHNNRQLWNVVSEHKLA